MKKYLTIGNVFKGLIALTVLIFIILFFADGCGQGDKAKKIKEESDAAKARYESKIKSLDAELTIKQDSMNTLKHEREEAVQARNTSAMLVRQTSGRAAELARQLDAAKKDKDTVRLLVVCDSLGDVVKIQEEQIKELIWTIDMTDSLMMYEVGIRDGVIEILQNKFIAADSAYSGEKARFNQLFKALKPTGSIWLGAKVQYTPLNPINQAGVFILYQTKNGKQFGIGAGLQNKASWYAEASGAFKISFRKK